MKIKIAILVCLFLCILSSASAGTYYMTGTVEAVDYTTDTFKIVDCEDGNVWVFDEIEDWWIGDIVWMTMDDNGTEDPTDDICTDLRYLCNPE